MTVPKLAERDCDSDYNNCYNGNESDSNKENDDQNVNNNEIKRETNNPKI